MKEVIKTKGPKENLQKFTSFRTRCECLRIFMDSARPDKHDLFSQTTGAKSVTNSKPQNYHASDAHIVPFYQTGRESQLWLLSKIQEVTAKHASSAVKGLISINEFPHSWGQNSILVKIAGSNKTEEGGVIISAHQDSTNMWPFLPAPGADDDGCV